MLYRPTVKIHFPLDVQIASNIFLFIPWAHQVSHPLDTGAYSLNLVTHGHLCPLAQQGHDIVQESLTELHH